MVPTSRGRLVVPMPTTTFNIQTADGQMDGVFCRPDGTGPWPGAMLFMDAMGVRPELIGMAERLSSNGFAVAVPNLYYRSGPQPPVNVTAFATPGPERERVFALMHSINHALVMRDTASVLDFLDREASVSKMPIGTVGYCMGGGYALTAAGTYPDRVGAAASFHGGWLATDRPDSPHRLAPRFRANLYVGVADNDPLCPPDEVERLRDTLTKAGCTFAIEVYQGAKHGFSVTGHPAYDRAASERHWTRLLDLFKSELA